MRTSILVGVMGSLLPALSLAAGQAPAIAVTDLAYTQAVSQYFAVHDAKSSSNATMNQNLAVVSGQSQSTHVAGTYNYMEQRELGSFTNDIKGALLKGTTFRLVQGKAFDAGDPQHTKAEEVLNQVKTGEMAKLVRQPEVKDIIARIKKGEFPGADYVLFGTLSNIQFVDENNPLQGTTSATYKYGIDLVADFSLIDTKTYEIKGAFSAEGTGQDMRIMSNRGDSFTPNRSKVMRQTSQSLAADVFEQLAEQLQIANPDMGSRVREQGASATGGSRPTAPAPRKDEVTILR
jgi:hypothetical protein